MASAYTSFMHGWRKTVKGAGLPSGTGPHALWHAFRSLLIAGGESVKAVSERLGHTNVAMTLNVDSHLFSDSEDRTCKAVDAAYQDRADSVRTEGDNVKCSVQGQSPFSMISYTLKRNSTTSPSRIT